MVIKNNIRSLAIATVVIAGSGVSGAAQIATPAPPQQGSQITSPQQGSQTTPKTRKPPTVRPGTVSVENRVAPQVVTILHRLNGIKMFRLLLRSNEDVKAISKLDEAFNIANEVHTNVIAGLSLDDGQTIVAWLPDAAAEMGPLPAPFASPGAGPSKSPRSIALAPQWTLPGASSFFERPDMTVIARDGQRLKARYVGFDGGTGLCILRLADKKVLPAADANEQTVGIGQRMRLLGPEQVTKVTQSESPVGNTIYARIGETEGRVVGISRAPSGAIARVRIRSGKLSAAQIGSIVINDAGETVGIVDAVDSNEATVMPSSLVRNAAKRVLKRQSSVPRPWLGISGEPVENLQFEQIIRRGWQREGAKSLAEARRGIMLTSVAAGSPAAAASLRSGDVILSANHEVIKSTDDLSWLLEEVEPGAAVRFTVARPNKPAPEAVELKLSEFPDYFYQSKWPDVQPPKATTRVEQQFKPGAFPGSSISSSLMSQGIETIGLLPPAASQFGVNGGLLVISVHPATAAFKAGLRTGDVIEAIDGHEVSSPAIVNAFSNKPEASYSFTVVRNKEKIVVKVEYAEYPR